MRARTPFGVAVVVVLLGAVGVLAYFTRAEVITIPDSSEDFHLFVLAGQSNMVGIGPFDEEPADDRVAALDESGRWVIARDPLHFDHPASDGATGVGPGRSFAEAYAAANPGVTVGLIPCAVGGSPISSWEPGGIHNELRPWDSCSERTFAALGDGVLKGVLWHQGETDAVNGEHEVYAARLRNVVERMRSTFNSPDVPFLVGQLGSFEGRPWTDSWFVVDAAHRELPDLVSNTAFVSSDGLTDQGDLLHFDDTSARELGRRYFAALSGVAPHQLTS